MRDFETAVGQFLIYRLLLSKNEPERKLYLAVSEFVHRELCKHPIILFVLQEFSIPLIVIDQFAEEVSQWIG